MTARYKRIAWFAIVCLLVGHLSGSYGRPLYAGTYAAYSLKEAERLLRNGEGPGDTLRRIAAITRPMGIVYDDMTGDLILVGEIAEGRPSIFLDDFVVPLRTVLKEGTAPTVSIDRTPETDLTGKQIIRFWGGVGNTAYGRDLLNADLVLKKLGLGVLQPDVAGVKPYFDMFADSWQETGNEESVLCRFWFVPARNSYTAYREGVAVVKELRVGVKTELMMAFETRGRQADVELFEAGNELAEKFAQSLTVNYSELARRHPELMKLDSAFRLAGIAEGIQRLQRKYKSFKPDLHYWLEEYSVACVTTPSEYPLLTRSEFLRKDKDAKRMSVDGGIELKMLVLELNDGDVTAFRDIVLRSRPDGNPLAWSVQLEGWQMLDLPDATDGDLATSVPNPIGLPRNEELQCSFRTEFSEAYVQDDMQQRLESIGMMLPQQIYQPHALDLLQEQANNHNHWQNALSRPDYATVYQPAPSSFTPIESPTVMRESFTPPESFAPPPTFNVPEAMAWMDRIETPPPSFEVFESEYHRLDTIEPLARPMDSPLDTAWTAVNQPIHQPLPTWNAPTGGTGTFGSSLTPDFHTTFDSSNHGYSPASRFDSGAFAPTHSPISTIPSIQGAFQSYHDANTWHNTIQQPGYTPSYTPPTYSPPSYTPSYSPPSYTPSYSAPSFTPYSPM
jgi:hypothetical protein